MSKYKTFRDLKYEKEIINEVVGLLLLKTSETPCSSFKVYSKKPVYSGSNQVPLELEVFIKCITPKKCEKRENCQFSNGDGFKIAQYLYCLPVGGHA